MDETAMAQAASTLYELLGLRDTLDKALPRELNRSAEIGELAAAMAKALSYVESVKPAGHNTFHHYHYVTIGQVSELARDAFSRAELGFFPTVKNVHVDRQQYPDDNGRSKMQTYCLVELEFMFVYGEQWLKTAWRGEGVDSGDKAYNKAYSAALKQGLMKTLLIGDEEDGDGQSPQRAATAPRQKRERKPKRAQAPAEPKESARDELARLVKKFHAIIGPGELAERFKGEVKARWGIESITGADPRKLGALCDALAQKNHKGDGSGLTERAAYMVELMAEWNPAATGEPGSQERAKIVGMPCEHCGELLLEPDAHGEGICAPPEQCPICGGDPLVGGHGVDICHPNSEEE